MHRHNNKYGYGNILRQYCQVDDRAPIMGELQHSLFVSSHFFSENGVIGPRRPQGQFPIVLFSWNAILPFRQQFVIGDPYLYLPSDIDETSTRSGVSLTGVPLPLVMPKMNQELSIPERVAAYQRLVDEALDLAGTEVANIALHPSDGGLMNQLKRVANSHSGIALRDDPPVRKFGIPIMNTSIVVSDYFGAHVFRANAFLGLPTHVSERGFHRALDPNIRQVFEGFQEASPTSSNRKHMSELLLGFDFKRESEELKERLFWSNSPDVARRIAVAGYKSMRRLKVRLRESRLLGKSLFWQEFTSRVLRSHWERQFLRSKMNSIHRLKGI